mmetsp:Transcript_1160/g.3394  ORF Transcript_1160/g.3394 Transcript_1160/m.3394 type:complete len:206 (+) Transcript_1160:258-875(+)
MSRTAAFVPFLIMTWNCTEFPLPPLLVAPPLPWLNLLMMDRFAAGRFMFEALEANLAVPRDSFIICSNSRSKLSSSSFEGLRWSKFCLMDMISSSSLSSSESEYSVSLPDTELESDVTSSSSSMSLGSTFISPPETLSSDSRSMSVSESSSLSSSEYCSSCFGSSSCTLSRASALLKFLSLHFFKKRRRSSGCSRLIAASTAPIS